MIGSASTPSSQPGSITTTDSTSGGSGAAKAQLYHYTWASQGQADAGTRLDELTALGYWARRDGTSTNNAAQAVSLNVEVDYVGDGSSYTTLVFEPVYNTYQQAQADDAWQYWDAIDGGNAVWWSSRAIPGVCAGSCFVRTFNEPRRFTETNGPRSQRNAARTESQGFGQKGRVN